MTEADVSNLFRLPRPLDLSKVDIPSGLRIGMLGPHPDDFDAIAWTMRVLRERGGQIDLAVVTDGASGVDDAFLPGATQERRGLIRDDEQRASLRYFGLPEEHFTFLHLREDETGHPVVDSANVDRIRTFLRMTLPQIVFLPHGNDTNPGHRRTYEMFRMVVREERMTLGSFLIRDPKTVHMRIDCYTGYDDEGARWKSTMLLHHRSQHERNLRTRQHGFDERILRVNRQAAAELGLPLPYAETFQMLWFERGIEASGGIHG